MTTRARNTADIVEDAVATYTAKANGYLYNSTVYFTSNDTFTKADYPWLRAIRVKVQGAGGGGGGSGTVADRSGGGGGGGGYSESFISDIPGLSGSISVTVGAAGSGGAAGANNGTAGGNSSFAALVVCSGGGGAQSGDGSFVGNNGGTVTTPGDFSVDGGSGAARVNATSGRAGVGGTAMLGFAAQVQATTSGETNATLSPSVGFGSGGGGSRRGTSNLAGANGRPGIVIVELYA